VKVTTQTIENRQAELVIEVEDERIEAALRRAARHFANTVKIPGFRKGRAPYQAVRRAVGEEALYGQVIRDIGQDIYREALEQSQLDVYGAGRIDDVQFKPFVLKATVPLRPTVELGDYRSLRVPFTAPTVTDEMIDEVLKDVQERNTTLEPAGEGPVEYGQVAVLTVEGRLGQGDDSPLIVSEQGIAILVEPAADLSLFPGFVQQIVGMKVGEEKSFELVVPEDSEAEDLRGKAVNFRVRLEDLKIRRVPPLDDALAQTVGEYETLEALRDNVRQRLLQRAMREAEDRYSDTCLRKLAEQARIEFPPQMVEEELDRMIESTRQRLSERKMSLEEFLNIKKQSLEEYRSELRPRAENNIRQWLALSEFVSREGLKVTDDEVQRFHDALRSYNEQTEGRQLSLPSEQTIRGEMLAARAIMRLTSICKGENPPLEMEAESLETSFIMPDSETSAQGDV